MKTHIVIASLLASSLFAHALTIPIVPPAHGVVVRETSIHVPVAPVPLSGTLALDLLLPPGEFARLYPVTLNTFAAMLVFQTSLNAFPGFAFGEGWLLDSLGNPLHSAQRLGSASSDDGRLGLALFPILSGELSAPLDFYGVHVDLTLPTVDAVEITACELRLLDGPIGIGPGVPATIEVPEQASTFRLLLLVLPFLLMGCNQLNYSSGNTKFSRTAIGTKNSVAELTVDVDPTNGVRHIHMKGYRNDQVEAIGVATEAAARGTAAGIMGRPQ